MEKQEKNKTGQSPIPLGMILDHAREDMTKSVVSLQQKYGLPASLLDVILTGVLSALAGVIMTARVTSGVTSTGDGYETDAIAAVVIGGTSLAGGKGRLWGTIVGILIMQFLSTGLDMLGVNAYYQMLVKGFVVIGAVMLDGLSSD